MMMSGAEALVDARMLLPALILLLLASPALGSQAQGHWTARYSVSVTSVIAGGLESQGASYTLTVTGIDGRVVDMGVKPYDKLGRLILGMIGYPDPQHFYLGSDAARSLYSWRRVRMGSAVYEPLFTPVAYGVGGRVVMGVLVRIAGPQGYKRAVYDAGSGLLLEEEFGLQEKGISIEYYKVSVSLQGVDGVSLKYMPPPASREERLAVYASSLIILAAAIRTVVLRHRYTVI